MIRRDWPPGAASPTEWRLVAQTEHARLARDLAAAWRSGAGPAPCAREEFLAAVLHHDDGWAPREAAPRVDPATGRPYDFLETPPDDARGLWEGSIDACRAIGPLAGWLVAGHFARLDRDRADKSHASPRWLRGVEERRAEWLREWLACDPRHSTSEATRLLAGLRAMDWFSLWLSFRAAAEGEPCGEPLMTTIGSSPAAAGGDESAWPVATLREAATPPASGRVSLSPWPFEAGELAVSVAAQRLPAARYLDTHAVLAAAQPIRLHWTLVPG